ncbi:MAG: bifunctional 3-(3-hydroxy-phenyl)propionate/3-hydroxycinnamic acid hydroxylase [Candidatus Binatia bacterium]
MSQTYDVAIVGYGPVGETLAILLAERGWRVGVFEKQAAAYPLPRAVHFDHETARILQAAGIADTFAGLTESADVYEWRNAAGRTLLRFESCTAGLSGWPDGNMFPQPGLERALAARARSFRTVDVRRGCEVLGLDARDDGVTLTAADGDGRRVAVDARYVVGCDGANSFVRGRLGADVTDLGLFYDWLIVDVLPHHPTVWSPLNIQICDPARPTTMVSGGPGRRRWEFMRLPGESLDELNREATAWRLLEPWDVRPDNARLERHAVYRFQARWVEPWRRGRLLIAGDAAHQTPPFAGQGMCAGLRDAMNLAWKLDLVLAGKAREALLDTYASERIPHVRTMINFAIELGRVICIADPAEAAARDQAMIAATAAGQPMPMPASLPIGPGLQRPGDASAGQLFPQGRVRRDGASGLCDDVIGRGWTLWSAAGDPRAHLDADAAAYFAALGGIAAHVGAGGLEDLDGRYDRWFADHGVAVALQRPDFYVFGGGARIEDGSALVRDLQAALA